MSTTGNEPPDDFTTRNYKIESGQGDYDMHLGNLQAADPLVYDDVLYVMDVKDASATDSGVVTTGEQILAGKKRFRGDDTGVEVEDSTGTKKVRLYYDSTAGKIKIALVGTTPGQIYGRFDFMDALPQSTLTPTAADELTTKAYVDSAAGSTSYKQYHLRASDFLNPNNSDWAVNALAPSIQDPTNNAIAVRAFDDTTEEGVGTFIHTPPSTTGITFAWNSRSTSSTGEYAFKVYARIITRNGTIGSWGFLQFSDVAAPGTAGYWHRVTYRYPYTSWSTALVADRTYQIEITRVAATPTNMPGDLYLGWMEIRFDND